MTIDWRWDQGRSQYFQFENTRRVAEVLTALDGIRLDDKGKDPLRKPLERTGMPFLPKHYRVWRNYARVFGAAYLAASVGNTLRVTRLCRELASGSPDRITSDDYFSYLIPRFYFPSPVFKEGYSQAGRVAFPMCAILRYLMTHIRGDGYGAVKLSEVFSRIIGNDCTGEESLDSYARLQQSSRQPIGDEARQVREFLRFFSQVSFLQWDKPDTLFLDIDLLDKDAFLRLEKLATPLPRTRLTDKAKEILEVGDFDRGILERIPLPERDTPEDLIFTEGSRVRAYHLRIERSPKLRLMLFSSLGKVLRCDICKRDMNRHYPWTDPRNMLEVHHLLPLGAAIKVGIKGTALKDLAPLCRSCHGGVHIYYRQWLKQRGLQDFGSRQDAVGVYEECKVKYVV